MRSLVFRLFLLSVLPFSAEARAYSRVICLTPVLSEWTAEILGDAEAAKTLVGVSEYSNYPAFLKKIETVGPYPRVSVEKIAALHPDLVLAQIDANSSAQVEQLKRLKLNVVLIAQESFAGMPGWIKDLGKALGNEKKAETIGKRWTAEVQKLQTKRPKHAQTVFFEIQHEPLVTIGGASFLNGALKLAGYENIFHDLVQGYPKVAKEAVLKAKPQAIFILDSTGNREDFAGAQSDWEKYGFHPKVISGDAFARCSFLLLKGLSEL